MLIRKISLMRMLNLLVDKNKIIKLRKNEYFVQLVPFLRVFCQLFWQLYIVFHCFFPWTYYTVFKFNTYILNPGNLTFKSFSHYSFLYFLKQFLENVYYQTLTQHNTNNQFVYEGFYLNQVRFLSPQLYHPHQVHLSHFQTYKGVLIYNITHGVPKTCHNGHC